MSYGERGRIGHAHELPYRMSRSHMIPRRRYITRFSSAMTCHETSGIDRQPPIVTVGMAVYNCEATLAAALESIRMQTFRDWELLVIDDGSTDATVAVAVATSSDDTRIRVIADGRRRRLAARLNECLDLGRGRLFARMDGDDVSYPERLERQVRFLQENPTVDLVGTNMLIFSGPGQVVGARRFPTEHAQIRARPGCGFPIAHPTYMGQMAWFRRHRYNERVLRAQDSELLLRSFAHSTFGNLPEILLGYREDSISLRKLVVAKRWRIESLARHYMRHGRIDRALWSCLMQAVGIGVTCIAIGTGLGYRMLRHRAAPVSEAERGRWTAVWRSVQPVVAPED